jgi:hypothetical protein
LQGGGCIRRHDAPKDAVESRESLSHASQAVYNAGDGLAGPDNQRHPQAVYIQGPGRTCSASVLASNIVISAGHCVNANPGAGDDFVPLNGTWTVAVSHNLPAAQAGLLPPGFEPWTTTTFVVHPDFTNNSRFPVDVALFIMPKPVPRVAVRPLAVARDRPKPALDPAMAGKPGAWTSYNGAAYGSGNTDVPCTSGSPSPVTGLFATVAGVEKYGTGYGLAFIGIGVASSSSHICWGDSGAPILTLGPQANTIGKNLPADQLFSLVSSYMIQSTEVRGPILQEPSMRSWLRQLALDRDNDGIESHDDICDMSADNTDIDGDGVGDNCGDNCLGKKNPDQVDKDHDGVGDACDVCPGGDDNLHSDHDGIADHCDPCPDGSGPNTDTDGDGWGDNCPGHQDNCPTVPNKDQKDEDVPGGDGVGDACDACLGGDDKLDSDHDGQADGCDPCDDRFDADQDGFADNCDLCPCDSTKTNDPDGDKICTSWAPVGSTPNPCWYVIPTKDNCPFVANAGQKNTNLASELVRGAEAVGDECEPVPVPYATTSGTSAWVAKNVVEWKLDSMNVRPFGSRSTGVAPATLPPDAGVPVNVPQTAYRYCHPLAFADIRCHYDQLAVGDKWLTESNAVFFRAQETLRYSWWRRVTMRPGALPPIPPDSNDGPMLYGGGPYPRTWLYLDDWAYWQNTYKLFWPSLPIPESEGQGWIGRFWLHGYTDVGMTDTSLGTGMHEKLGQPGVPADELANYYLPLDPWRRMTWFPIEQGPAGFPGWYFAYKYRACVDCPMLSTPGIEVRPPESQLVVPIRSQPGSFGILVPDGILPVEPGALGPALRASLADPSLVWLDQAEPNPLMGRGPNAPMAVALSSEGTVVRESVLAVGDRLAGIGDQERPPTHDPPIAKAAGGNASATPSPRSGFRGVYSRMMGWLFLVGGTEIATNQPARDIWMQSVGTGTWIRLMPKGYAPETVIAVTFSFGDNRLWVLDEVGLGPIRFARLARIDPLTGQTQTVGAWPRLRPFDRQWLAVDRDGSVLLVASSTKLKKHAVIRIRVAPPHPHVDRVRLGGFPLAGPIVVDDDGYWLVGTSATGVPQPVRLGALQGSTGNWDHVGACL